MCPRIDQESDVKGEYVPDVVDTEYLIKCKVRIGPGQDRHWHDKHGDRDKDPVVSGIRVMAQLVR